jgi:hypothetical protein
MSGDVSTQKVSKVAWNFLTRLKGRGGLGVRYILIKRTSHCYLNGYGGLIMEKFYKYKISI